MQMDKRKNPCEDADAAGSALLAALQDTDCCQDSANRINSVEQNLAASPECLQSLRQENGRPIKNPPGQWRVVGFGTGQQDIWK
jgi:hypothetical protein